RREGSTGACIPTELAEAALALWLCSCFPCLQHVNNIKRHEQRSPTPSMTTYRHTARDTLAPRAFSGLATRGAYSKVMPCARRGIRKLMNPRAVSPRVNGLPARRGSQPSKLAL